MIYIIQSAYDNKHAKIELFPNVAVVVQIHFLMKYSKCSSSCANTLFNEIFQVQKPKGE